MIKNCKHEPSERSEQSGVKAVAMRSLKPRKCEKMCYWLIINFKSNIKHELNTFTKPINNISFENKPILAMHFQKNTSISNIQHYVF